MKSYKPSNIAPPEGIQILALTTILTGVITGGLVSFVSQFFYLIVLFPLGMGFVGGFATSSAITKGKIRNPVLGVAFAALTGLITYGSLNYGDYLRFRQEAAQEITTQSGMTDKAEIDRTIDTILKDETGADGFVGYVKYSAKQGVQISKVGSGSGTKLNQEFTWFYWLVELAIIEFLAISMAYAAAAAPFCEDANEWYGEPKWAASAPLEPKDDFLNLLKQDEFSRAGELLLAESPLPRLDIYLRDCPSSQFSELVLTVNKTTQDKKGNVSSEQVLMGMVSHRQKADFLKPLELKNESSQLPEVEPEQPINPENPENIQST